MSDPGLQTPLPFANVPEVSVEAFVAQAERFLDGTVQLGIAADSKSITLMSVAGALAAALAAAVATMLVAAGPIQFRKPIAACAVGAALLVCSVFCFSKATLPTDFQVSGFEPRLLGPSASNRLWMLRYVADSLQRRIDLNRRAIEISAKWIRRGVICSWMSALAALFAYLVS